MQKENLNADFERLLKEVINPFFKERGFRRKGTHFAKQLNDIFQTFNVQKSQWNSYHDSLSFTFNLGFYNHTLYLESWGRSEIKDFPKHYDSQIEFRLGNISHGRDYWYKLTKAIPFEKVKHEVEQDLNKHVDNLFNKHQTLQSLENLIGNYSWIDNVIGPYNRISILWHTGKKNEAKKQLQTQYKKALIPQSSTATIVYPDGRKEEKVSKPTINQSYIENIERLAKLYGVPLIKE